MSRTIRQLRHSLSRRSRDLWTGTLTTTANAGDQQIRDTSRVESQDFFQNFHAYVDTDSSGEEMRVIQSAPGALSFPSQLVGSHTSGTVYEMHRRFSVSDYNGFIHDAVLSAGFEAVRATAEDETVLLTANAEKPGGLEDEYEIPSGFRYITEIWFSDIGGVYRSMIPLDQVRVVPGTVRKLRFTSWALGHGVVGSTVRILGMTEDTVPNQRDSSTIYVDPDFVITAAEELVLNILAQGDGPIASWANSRLRTQTALVELKREQLVSQHRVTPGALVVPA